MIYEKETSLTLGGVENFYPQHQLVAEPNRALCRLTAAFEWLASGGFTDYSEKPPVTTSDPVGIPSSGNGLHWARVPQLDIAPPDQRGPGRSVEAAAILLAGVLDQVRDFLRLHFVPHEMANAPP